MKLRLPIDLYRTVLATFCVCFSLVVEAEDYTLENKRRIESDSFVADATGATKESNLYAPVISSLSLYNEVLISNNKGSVSIIITHPDETGADYYANATSHVYGGAIYSSNALTLSRNSIVNFSYNSASAYAETTSETHSDYDDVYLVASAKAYGGAIYSSSADLRFENNGSVTFAHNAVSAAAPTRYRGSDEAFSSEAFGGAIANMGGDTYFLNNSYVEFNSNSVHSTPNDTSYYCGGGGDL